MSFFEHTRKPQGLGGKIMVAMMNSGSDISQNAEWAEKIGGMTIYNGEQIKTYLTQAEFSSVQIHKNEKGWICATARK